jgi:hypothetical protein
MEVAVPTWEFGSIAVCTIDEMLGAARLGGVVIVNGIVFDIPAEFETVIPAAPENAESVGKVAAVTCVALTKVVMRGEPFQYATDPLTKFAPLIVNVNPFGLVQ